MLGVLLGALVPAVGSVGRANRLTSEGNRVAGLAELARQQAVAKNAVTALVMDEKSDGNGEARWAFSIWQLEADAVGQPAWRQISRAETLKDGVAVDENIVETENTSSAVGSLEGEGRWVFLPTGGLLGSKSGLLSLTEPGKERGSRNHYTLNLLNATGRVKVSRN